MHTSQIFMTWRLRGDCQKSRDSEGSSSWHWVHVHPERHPGDDHNKNGRQIALNQVETNRSAQVELGYQTTVIT